MWGEKMYQQPFTILREKIPFVEYIWRIFLFLRRPCVETKDELKTGYMRFALYDIFLSVSLLAVIASLMSAAIYELKASDLLSIFWDQAVLYMAFGFQAYLSVAFFFCILWIFLLFEKKPNRIEICFLASLHFARWMALFLLAFFPLIVFDLHFIFHQGMSLEQYIQQHLLLTYVIIGIFIALYLYLCLRPLWMYLFPSKRRWVSSLLIIALTAGPTAVHKALPTIPITLVNSEKVLELFQRTEQFQKLSPEKKAVFNKKVLQTIQ
jgi:hypothetical protein